MRAWITARACACRRASWRAKGSEGGMLKYAIVVEHENDLPAYVHVDPVVVTATCQLRSSIHRPTIFNTAHPNCLPQ